MKTVDLIFFIITIELESTFHCFFLQLYTAMIKSPDIYPSKYVRSDELKCLIIFNQYV